MLSPIPCRILTDTVTFYVPGGFDEYQTPTGETQIEISHVHLQADNVTRRQSTNASGYNNEVTLSGILFIDSRYSQPLPDLEALQRQTQERGGVMTCEVQTRLGGLQGPFTVLIVDALPDDEGRLHHYEIGVV